MAVDYSKIIENDFEEPIYISKYNELINYLTTYGPTEFWKIVREVGGSERRMMRLIEEMINEGTIEFVDNKFNLKNNVSKYNYNMKEVEQKMKDIWDRKPIPTLFFDQRPVTLETTINRVKYLLQKNDVYDKKIVMLGDDDLTSVALALRGVNF
jgi:predicted methyltransferase